MYVTCLKDFSFTSKVGLWFEASLKLCWEESHLTSSNLRCMKSVVKKSSLVIQFIICGTALVVSSQVSHNIDSWCFEVNFRRSLLLHSLVLASQGWDCPDISWQVPNWWAVVWKVRKHRSKGVDRQISWMRATSSTSLCRELLAIELMNWGWVLGIIYQFKRRTVQTLF